jgi:transposase
MAAVTQVSHRHSSDRAYYERKLAEGKIPKEALRSLKRRVSDAVFAQLQTDARRLRWTHAERSPGGQQRNDSFASAAGSHPWHRLLG